MSSHVLCLRGQQGSYPHARAAMRGRTSARGWERRRDDWSRSATSLPPRGTCVQLYPSAGFTWRVLHKIKSLKVAVGVGKLGWSQTRAYLKLILHLHATFSLIYCHSGSQKPSSAFIQASCSPTPSIWAPSVDELNITAT